jgi:hypothetical protein
VTLADLAEGLDGDNLEEYEGEDDADDVDDKPLAEWVSMDWMTDEEREELDLTIIPVHSMLMKVS